MAVLAQAWISIPEWFLKRVFCSLLSFAMAVSHVHGWLISNMRVRHSQGWGWGYVYLWIGPSRLGAGLRDSRRLMRPAVVLQVSIGRQWRRPSRQSIWRGWQPSALTHTHTERHHTHIYIYTYKLLNSENLAGQLQLQPWHGFFVLRQLRFEVIIWHIGQTSIYHWNLRIFIVETHVNPYHQQKHMLLSPIYQMTRGKAC